MSLAMPAARVTTARSGAVRWIIKSESWEPRIPSYPNEQQILVYLCVCVGGGGGGLSSQFYDCLVFG